MEGSDNSIHAKAPISFVRTLVCDHSGPFDRLSLVSIESVKQRLSGHAIEGVILLRISGVDLITVEMWDEVNAMWGDFINAVESLDSNDKHAFLFPDQPIEVEFMRTRDDNVIVKVGDSSAIIGYGEFRQLVLAGAVLFFDRARVLHPRDAEYYNMYLKRSNRLKTAKFDRRR